MKIFRQLSIIIGIFLLGEVLSKNFNLFLPGNILGMLILLLLLCTKIIKLTMIEDVAKFFLDHLAFFFLPAGVGLMTSFDLIKPSLAKILILCIITTILVISITGITVEKVIKKQSSKRRK